MRQLRMWAISASILIALGLTASLGFGSLMVRPSPSHVSPAKGPARDLKVHVGDGIALAATYWPGRTATSPAVLLLHGNNASREAMKGNADWLARNGFAVLAVDFRGHGQSTATGHTFGWDESRDAKAAFTWLKRSQHGAPVAIVGVSLGGAASLIGEDGPIPADALVLQAVYPDIRHAIRNRIASIATVGPAYLLEPLLSFQSKLRFGIWPNQLSPLTALPAFRGPVLIIGGGADCYTPPSESREMFNAATGPKTIWLADGADHATVSDLHSDAYRHRLLAFLTQSIGLP